jgi:hypothetical protein
MGQELAFHISRELRNDKMMATESQISLALAMKDDADATASSQDTVKIHAFSMNLRFAALLANGHKNLESRDGTMFVPHPAGTQMLLHVGQQTHRMETSI